MLGTFSVNLFSVAAGHLINYFLVVAGDMDSGSYFSDLINLLVQESQDHGPAAAKGSQGRTKNFRDDEDRLLVSAWLNVGMDPIRGVDQSQASYWERIHDYFHANKSFESDRT